MRNRSAKCGINVSARKRESDYIEYILGVFLRARYLEKVREKLTENITGDFLCD